MNEVNSNDVKALTELFDGSSWTEMHLHVDEFELHLSKDGRKRHRIESHDQLGPAAPVSSRNDVPEPRSAAASPAPANATDMAVPEGASVVRAPNLGTFYRSPKPGAPPYIEVGQQVESDTDVCLIEVMKLFTPVKAGVAGKIVEILVTDAELVEFDQPLFIIRPSDS